MSACGLNFETTYTSLPEFFYSRQDPVAVASPEIVIFNEELAREMGLDFSQIGKEEQAALFSGNALPEGAAPFAQAYAGHQFGHFTILGDGRAVMWGEHITPEGKRHDIQFKGSGRTPYSRRGDGRAALGPMLREYLISEAMHHLGIPTTRSLAVVTTGEFVRRERSLPGAILTRIASSHLRVGTFELPTAYEEESYTQAIANYTIKRHYPEIEGTENPALELLKAVMEKQIDLVINWMRVGFIHGVLNTDNVALCGETIDYGPCAFIDAYAPDTVFSSIDEMGRYAFANQPKITQWNLARFAETLLPLIDPDREKSIELAKEVVVQSYPAIYEKKWLAMMRSKLGLSGEQDGDKELINDLLSWMHKNQADYTNTFRDLTQQHLPEEKNDAQPTFQDWLARWQERTKADTLSPESAKDLMKKHNPQVIPRNHKVEEALSAAEAGNLKPFNEALAAFKAPYDESNKRQDYLSPPPPSKRVYQTFCGT